MSILTFAATGLVFTIAGGGILARSFALTSDTTLATQAAPTFERLRHSVEELTAKRVDIRFGAPVFLTGLYLQLLSAIGLEERPTAMVVMLALLAVVLLYYGLMRSLIAHNDRDRVHDLASGRLHLVTSEAERRGYYHAAPLQLVETAARA